MTKPSGCSCCRGTVSPAQRHGDASRSGGGRAARARGALGIALLVHGAALVQTSLAHADEPKSVDAKALEDELSLDNLLSIDVTSAAKTAQSAEEAPSIVSVVTAKEIRERGYKTIGDALRHLPGLYVINDLVSYDVGVRGIHGPPGAANETVKVMINGWPISLRSTGENRLGYDLIPVEAVRQIEILRSPGSALYGANAFLAVINIITYSKGDANDPLSKHAVAIQGHLTQNPLATTTNGTISAVSGDDIGKFHYFTGAVLHRGDRSGLVLPGYENIARTTAGQAELGYPSPGWNLPHRRYLLRNGTTRDDTITAASAYALGSYDLGSEFTASVDFHLQYSDQAAEFAYFAPMTHNTRLSYVNGFGRMVLAYGSNKTHGLSFQVSLGAATGGPTRADHIVDRTISGFYKRRVFGYRAFDGAAEVSYAFGSSPDKSSNKITLGVDTSSDNEDLMALEVVNEKTNVTERESGYGRKRFANLGGYLQWLSTPFTGFNTTLGSRFDYNSQIACNSDRWGCFSRQRDIVVTTSWPSAHNVLVDNRGLVQFSNRAAVVYAFPWAGLFAKAIYSSSFKPPSPFQLYHKPLTAEGSTVGDPTLKPQTANTVELQLGGRPFNNFYVAVTNFYSYVSDTVRYFKDESVLRGRNANIELAGVEAETRYVVKSAATTLFANASFLYYQKLQPERLRTETDIRWNYSPFQAVTKVDRYPDLMIKAGINVAPPNSHLNVNLLGMYVGARPASLINGQLYNWNTLSADYELDPYVTFDITVSSVDLHLMPWFNDKETVLSVSLQNIGPHADPGFGGIDIPSLGPRAYLGAEQTF